MQRPSTEEIRAQCLTIATVAHASNTLDQIAELTGMPRGAVKRRVLAMGRDLGLDPALPGERGGGRHPADGTERAHSREYRRAGAIAERWRRHCL